MDPCKFYKCLADDTRLRSLLLISQVGECCVCHLMEALELEQPKISRHLAELRKCQILLDNRRGKWVYYRLHPNLPQWANEVIVKTAECNNDYFGKALTHIQSSITNNCQ
jgi:ArsR family transcriptional regulator